MTLLDIDLNSFTCIKTEDDLRVFFRLVKGLHDCTIKEITWVTEDEVRQDLSVYYGNNDVARLIIHSQYEASAIIELIAVKVDWLSIRPRSDLDATGVVKDGRITVLFAGGNPRNLGALTCGFICQSLYYRIYDKMCLKKEKGTA